MTEQSLTSPATLIAAPVMLTKSIRLTIDGHAVEAQPGELLVDIILANGKDIPHVCYHPQLGPIQTCDTCLVEMNGQLVRACVTKIETDATIVTESARARNAQLDAFDRILQNHLLYCTVCDNNNGNCTVHKHDRAFKRGASKAAIPA